jgi:RNA polymerase sigma factor (sigma-70 family)
MPAQRVSRPQAHAGKSYQSTTHHRAISASVGKPHCCYVELLAARQRTEPTIPYKDPGSLPTQVARRSDARLVNLVRQERVDAAALDELVERHWESLSARCLLLTQNRDQACDLAQETWVRVLQARRQLEPDGNFPGYLRAIATNLWRDWNRLSKRGRGLSARHLHSIDSSSRSDDGEGATLLDVLPEPRTLDAEGQAQLAIDRALASLSPRLRDVLVAGFVDGESAASIGQRYCRTQQTVTGWLRQATRQLQPVLGRRRVRLPY